jgi:tetratricopeptide (TPR) repeat protein
LNISPDLIRAIYRPGHGLFFAALLFVSPALAQGNQGQHSNSPASISNNYQQNHLIFQRLNSADELIKTGKLVHARLLLEKLVLLDPNPYSAQTHELLGQVSFQLGNNQDAIANYLQALKYDNRSLPSHWNLALAYMQENNYDQAISWAKKTLSKNPSSAMKQQINRFLGEMEEKKQEQSQQTASGMQEENDYLESLVTSRQANRWPAQRLPLKYFIHRNAMENMQAHYPDLFKTCLRKWQEASANHLAFLEVNNPQMADIELRFTNDLKQVATQEGAAPVEQGIARTSVYDSDTTFNTIEKSIITILLIRPFSKAPLNDDQMKETMLHELGHSLGLGGHSPHASDIMNFSQNFKQLPALTKRDKRTMARLYETYPALDPDLSCQAPTFTGSHYNTNSNYFSPGQNLPPGFNNNSGRLLSPQPINKPAFQPTLLDYP